MFKDTYPKHEGVDDEQGFKAGDDRFGFHCAADVRAAVLTAKRRGSVCAGGAAAARQRSAALDDLWPPAQARERTRALRKHVNTFVAVCQSLGCAAVIAVVLPGCITFHRVTSRFVFIAVQAVVSANLIIKFMNIDRGTVHNCILITRIYHWACNDKLLQFKTAPLQTESESIVLLINVQVPGKSQ